MKSAKKSSSFRFFCLGVVALAAIAATAPAAIAQTQITTGTIRGTVSDPSGAIVPGASISILNLDTNLERNTTSDDNGRFVAPQLPPGRYVVTVTQMGFASLRQEDIVLTVGQSISLALSLTVSGVQETIVVSGTPTVDTVRTESSSTLNERTIESTPTRGRKFEDLLTLTPGVSIVQGPDGDEINFNGQRGIFNNISLDGGDYNNSFFGDQMGGQRAQIDITMEAIKEFQVIATGASAEFGRTAGGIVNVVTKSGTNEVHGAVFHFQRLEALSADTSDGQPLKDFEREQFGGTIGGPIVENEMFLFGAFEQIIAELTRPNLSNPLGACSVTGTPNILTDEAAIDAEPECQRLALLDFFQTTLSQEEGDPVSRPIRNTAFFLKYDWNLSASNQLSASYNFDRSKNTNETFDVATFGNSANGIEGSSIIQVANANFFSTLGANRFNEFHFTYSREKRPRAAIPSNVPADTGMGFAPTFRFGNPYFLQPGVDELFWKTQVKDNFSVITGSHNIKVGGEWIHNLNSQVFRGFFTGRFIFDSVAGFLRYASPASLGPGFGPTVGRCTGGGWGNVDVLSSCASGFENAPLLLYLQSADRDGVASDAAGASSITNEDIAFFVQDKWQIRPNFTLSLGLRWEAQIMPTTVDPTTTAYAQFLGDSTPNVLGIGFPSDGTIPDQTDMWQPRVAIAWDILDNQKSVLRASWGIYSARQNMLTQVGSVTTNGLQQQTIFRDTGLIGFLLGIGVPFDAAVPTWPGVTQPAPVSPGTFPDFSGVRAFDKNYENPRIYTGNVAYEQEIYPNWSLYIDATLSNGTRLSRFIDINRADRGDPFGPGLGETMIATSIGQSTYVGATVGMRKKFSQGFQLDWNYTWSQDEDDDSNERDPFVDRSIDPFDLSVDFSLSDRDIKHKVNLAGSFELPSDFDLSVRLQGRSAQPISGPLGRNTLRKNNKFFSLDWRVERPFRWGDGRYALIPIFEMFNSFDNDNTINPLNTDLAFNFDGFLRQGVGDPLQIQLAVKFTF